MIQDRSHGKSKFGNFDTTTLEGAQKLCDLIKAHWARQGKLVTAWPILLPRDRDRDGKYWSVKSDLQITRWDAPLPEIVEGCALSEKPAKPRKKAA